MTLPLEQTEQIKQQIIQQIENTFPEDKKESAIQQIEEMNESELENFLAQNNLIKTSENEEKQCIFCSIVSEKIPGYKISENDSALAVLEINPVSKGHTLIIPKVHVQEISKKTQDFAEEVSIKLKEKLNAKSIQTEDSEMFGHKIVNIIPIYDNKTLETKKATYWSRSRNKLWIKGEESGNVQNVKEILIDCDNDSVLLKVEQVGDAACHTGYKTCFYRNITGKIKSKKIFNPEEVYKK